MELSRYKEIIVYKSYTELRAEAARSYLGIGWWVLEPVLYMAVFYLVFSVFRKRGDVDFISFLLVGLVSWKWFASTIAQGANSIAGNAGLMRQVYLPKQVFPYIVVLTNTLKFFIIFTLLVAFLLIAGTEISITWTALPVLILLQLLLLAGIASFLAAFVPIVPDLRIVIENGLMLVFFLSGIFFDINEISNPARQYLLINPMAGLFDAYRNVLIHGSWPSWGYLLYVAFVAAFFLIVGGYLIKRLDRIYPKIVM